MSTDIFGTIIDATAVETALRDTLQARLPEHLAHQERQAGIASGTLLLPRSWPTISDFDLEVQDQLPAIVIVSPGTVGAPVGDTGGWVRKTWRFEVAVAIAGKDETEGRMLGSLYLAAIFGALGQNQTLGGVALRTRNVGPDDHAYGLTERGAQRAIYGTAFEVTVRNALNERLGPAEPLPDPYNPPDQLPGPPFEVDVIVTHDLDEEPSP